MHPSDSRGRLPSGLVSPRSQGGEALRSGASNRRAASVIDDESDRSSDGPRPACFACGREIGGSYRGGAQGHAHGLFQAHQVGIDRSARGGGEIAAPLILRDRVIGVLRLVMTNSGRTFSDADASLAQDVAHHGALAIHDARLYEAAKAARRPGTTCLPSCRTTSGII